MEAERTERRLWKQTIQAYAVDQWAMCDVRGGPFTSPLQHADINALLAAYPGSKTLLIAPDTIEAQGVAGSIDLKDYTHPADAIYVFGSSPESLVNHIGETDDVVTIRTPVSAAMFGHVALSAVLYDRMVKQS